MMEKEVKRAKEEHVLLHLAKTAMCNYYRFFFTENIATTDTHRQADTDSAKQHTNNELSLQMATVECPSAQIHQNRI